MVANSVLKLAADLLKVINVILIFTILCFPIVGVTICFVGAGKSV